MTELLSSAQMRALERADIESGLVSGPELMERAGRGAVAAIFAAYPKIAPAWGPTPKPSEYVLQDNERGRLRAVVLCGPGNNGGDGFVIARLLQEAGWSVEVFFAGAEARPAEARLAHGKWAAVGEVRPLAPEATREGERPDLLIDAMLGIGVTRPLKLEWAEAWQGVRRREGRRRCHEIAIDCPSGFDCDTGEFILPAIPEDEDAMEAFMSKEFYPRLLHSDYCVTFHRPKLGHYLSEVGLSRMRPAVVDIGLSDGPEIDDPAYALGSIREDGRTRLVCPPADARPQSLKIWLRHAAFSHVRAASHKYDRGHAFVLGGGVGKGGAARLAARGALRIGAGLVTVGVPPGAVQENAAQLNAIMLRPIVDAEALADALTDDRLTAVCMGPGLGVGERTRGLVRAVCAAKSINDGHDTRRVVLDADALTSFADEPETLFEILHKACVLTPHEGEFVRLFPDLSARARHQSGRSRLDAAKEAAQRAGCIILLKGPATIIASPDGTTSIHAALYDRSAPWLGTAGAGDVLAGMITGLLASPMASFSLHQIVEVASYLHVEAARAFGPGLTSEDLPETLPQVLRNIGL